MKIKKFRQIRSFFMIFVLILPILLLLSTQCKNGHERNVSGHEIEINVKENIVDTQNNRDKNPYESSLKILTQNTMLIPFNFVAPAFRQRAGHIAELIQDDFDIVCLQEVVDGSSQNRIVSSWHEMIYQNTITGNFSQWQIDYFKKWFDLLSGKDKKMWSPLTMAGDAGTLSKNEDTGGVKIIDTLINDIEAKIVFGPYYVMGPDRGKLNIRQDGGLVILSRYPIIAASSLSHEKSSGSDRMASKGAIYARVQVGPSSKDYVHVFNTHIQAHDYGETRLEQIKELMAFIQEIVQSDNGKIHPIIVAGDFNVAAVKIDGWMEISDVTTPEDEINDNYKTGSNQEYEEFLEIMEDFSKNFATGKASGVYLKDSWLELNPQNPGLTWMGKDWVTGDKNSYGSIGNSVAIPDGEPKRIDYIFYFEGADTLKLEPVSANLVPEKPDLLYCFDKKAPEGDCSFKSYTVSDHLGVNLIIDFRRNALDS